MWGEVRIVWAAALLLGLPGAAAPVPGAVAPLPEIRGTVSQGDHRGLAGVLVALYDAGDLLVDSTYTRDDGGFRLRPPQEGGRLYVVATADGTSRRVNFDFDPRAGRSKRVSVPFPEKRESPLAAAGKWTLDKLGAVVGLLIGYFFRLRVEERGAARRKRNFFRSDLRAAVQEALDLYEQPRPETRLPEITAAVQRIRQLLERRADVEDVLFVLEQERGPVRFREVKERLRHAEDLLAQAPGLADIPKTKNVLAAKEALVGLRDYPLG